MKTSVSRQIFIGEKIISNEGCREENETHIVHPNNFSRASPFQRYLNRTGIRGYMRTFPNLYIEQSITVFQTHQKIADVSW
jgi:hypothetical protein